MCEAMSGIIAADRIVRWSDTDESHYTIVIQHKLHEGPSYRVGGANFVAYEYSPPDRDFRLPLDQWVYRVDDAFPLPDWYDEAECKALALEALPKWIAQKIVLPGESREVTNGHIVACYGSVVARDSSHVVARNSSRVDARDSSHVVAWDSSHVDAINDSATIQAYTAFDLAALKSPQAVLIDRTRDVPVCYVGVQKPKRARAKKSE